MRTLPGLPRFSSPLTFFFKCCFIALLFGNAILTSASRNAISRLTTGESALYVPSSSISMNSTFMGISWGSTVAMFVATIMMAWEWNVERFTPPGAIAIHEGWKPREVGWFSRAPRWEERSSAPFGIPGAHHGQASEMHGLR